jgi:hypothetical protein
LQPFEVAGQRSGKRTVSTLACGTSTRFMDRKSTPTGGGRGEINTEIRGLPVRHAHQPLSDRCWYQSYRVSPEQAIEQTNACGGLFPVAGQFQEVLCIAVTGSHGLPGKGRRKVLGANNGAVAEMPCISSGRKHSPPRAFAVVFPQVPD